jgi:hypothetical protein
MVIDTHSMFEKHCDQQASNGCKLRANRSAKLLKMLAAHLAPMRNEDGNVPPMATDVDETDDFGEIPDISDIPSCSAGPGKYVPPLIWGLRVSSSTLD